MKIRVEEGVAKRERCIGGLDVRDEKRFGVGEFVVGEERTDDGEKRKRRIRRKCSGNRRLSPMEERDEGFGFLSE